MAIQNRRGAYTDFDPTKMIAGEFAVVQTGDPNAEDGKAVYMAFTSGNVKRLTTSDDLTDMANSVYITDSASGSVAHFVDGADNISMKSVKVNIVPNQVGVGTPSPSNVIPISGWDSVTVNQAGENAMKPSAAFSETKNGVTFSSDGNGVYHIEGTNTSSSAVKSSTFTVPEFVIPLSTTHSLYLNNNTANSNVAVQIMNGSTVVDSWTFNAVNRISSNYGSMGDATCNGIRINVTAGQSVNITFIPMLIAKADTNTYTISLASAGTVYGGTLDVISGELTVDRVAVAMESLTWYRSTSYANPIFYTTVSGKASDYNRASCSIFRNIGNSSIIAAQGFANQAADGDFASSNGNAQLFVRLDSATTVQNFVTAVTGQTIVYPIATPLAYTLTATTMKSILGSNNVWSNVGASIVDYRADTKKYIDRKVSEAISALS